LLAIQLPTGIQVTKISGSIGRSLLVATGALLLTGVAGCSGSASSNTQAATTPSQHSAAAIQSPSSSASQPNIEPGHDTPQDAADGLISGELAKNFKLACSYVEPSSQATCTTGYSQSSPTFTGNYKIVGAVISGTEALVELTGRVCTVGDGGGCNSNSDPSAGMPKGSLTFAQAYHNTADPQSNAAYNSMSPAPCVLINKKWYVAVPS
jgi:hypothetical protein